MKSTRRVWVAPDLERLSDTPVVLSPEGTEGGDLRGRVPADELLTLITCVLATLGLAFVAYIEPSVWVFLSLAGSITGVALIVRHLRSGLFVNRHRIEIRRVFRGNVKVPWSEIYRISLQPGPWPIAREWCSMHVETRSRSIWVAQVRRPRQPNSVQHRGAGAGQLECWASVDGFIEGLDQLARRARS